MYVGQDLLEIKKEVIFTNGIIKNQPLTPASCIRLIPSPIPTGKEISKIREYRLSPKKRRLTKAKDILKI